MAGLTANGLGEMSCCSCSGSGQLCRRLGAATDGRGRSSRSRSAGGADPERRQTGAGVSGLDPRGPDPDDAAGLESRPDPDDAAARRWLGSRPTARSSKFMASGQGRKRPSAHGILDLSRRGGGGGRRRRRHPLSDSRKSSTSSRTTCGVDPHRNSHPHGKRARARRRLLREDDVEGQPPRTRPHDGVVG